MMFIWCKTSGERVMPSMRIARGDSAVLSLDSAKNMTVSGQICLRDYEDFDVFGVEAEKLPSNVEFFYRFAECITFHDGVPYPDILSNKKEIHVKSHSTQSIWVVFTVLENADVGESDIVLRVKTSAGDFYANVRLKVYSVTLPPPKVAALSQEYFFSATEYFSYKDVRLDVADRLPNFYKYERYSEDWWDLMRTVAKTMRFMRANVFWLPTMELLIDAGSKRIGKREWVLNFELVDKMIELFLENGSFYRIVIKDHIDPADGKAIKSIDENGKMCRFEVFTEDSEAWAQTFYSSLYQHFNEKGWLSMLFMHLQDEPHTSEYWQWAREKCRTCMPNVLCGEPLDMHSVAKQMEGYFDLYIPRVDIYHEDIEFYKKKQEQGAELWCYTCCYPEEHWWLNRFIDEPQIYCRQILWACFSQGITGYLHWGFNFWDSPILAGIQPGARFKGDGFIVYPDGENNTLALSVRLMATLDGAQEYELLSLLGQKNEDKAKELAFSVAKDFTDFSKDETCADKARRTLLNLLTE